MTRTDPTSEGYLKKDHLHPRSSVSVDHFESRIKGRAVSLFGRSASENMLKVVLFVNDMSGYLQVEHQLGF